MPAGGAKASFTLRQAREIRAMYQRGATATALAETYGVARSTIMKVIKGQVAPVFGATNLSRGRGRPPNDPRAYLTR